MKTLYDVLELSRLASKEAIDASHQRLVEDCRIQSDLNPGNEPEFKLRLDAIERAYAVLSDPQKRSQYDVRMDARPVVIGSPGGGYSDGLLSEFIEYVKRPLAISLAFLLPVVAVGYLLSDHYIKTKSIAAGERSDIRSTELKAAETRATVTLATQRLDTADKSVEYENEWKARQLEAENDRLNQEMGLIRQEQARKDRELEVRANASDRALKVQERQTDTWVRETNAERKHTNDVYDDEALDRRLDSLNKATEAVRDLNAARMGITRKQYEQIQEEQSGWRR